MTTLRLPLSLLAACSLTACVLDVGGPVDDGEALPAEVAMESEAEVPFEVDPTDADAFAEEWPEEEVIESEPTGEPYDDEHEEEPLDEPLSDSFEDDEQDSELFSALAAGSASAPIQRSKVFRVLDWNIAGGKENACRPDLIRRAVLRYVRNTSGAVDFISLNEVCPAQYQAIREALRRRWGKDRDARFSAFVRGGGSRVGNAIFSRRNLRRVNRIKVGEDQYGYRYVICGLQEGRRVRLCSAHLTPGDAKARKQMTRVLKRLEGFWSDKGDTVILAGDLNLTADDHGLNKVYAPGASTRNNPNNHGKYREWDDKDAVCKGYGERSLPWTTGGPCGKGRKIDFVFARRNRIVDHQYGANTLDIASDCTGVCSDHRAIRGHAKLKFVVD